MVLKVIEFLKVLRENNNREWFNDNKQLYLEAKDQFDAFVNSLIAEIELFDPSARGLTSKNTVFRIYRDVRFSKNKLPYKTRFSAYIAPDGRKSRLAGYYIHIEPGNCMAGGGLHRPNGEKLKEVRFEIYNHGDEFNRIIREKGFRKTFGELIGDKLKRPPTGFPKEFPYIELVKQKEYLAVHTFDDEKLKPGELMPYLIDVFKTMKPMNDFLNRPLKG